MSRRQKASTFLKECMADALIGRMTEKAFSDITINEIADAAGVNRSTWFRHFRTKSEALTYKIVQLWRRFGEGRGILGRERNSLDNPEVFFHFFYENRAVFEQILSSGQPAAIYQAFYEIMMPQFEADAAECYQSRFLSYGLFGLLGEWIKRNYAETPDEMVVLFHRFLRQTDPDEA